MSDAATHKTRPIPIERPAELRLEDGRIFTGRTRALSFAEAALEGIPVPVDAVGAPGKLEVVVSRSPRRRVSLLVEVIGAHESGAEMAFRAVGLEHYHDLRNLLIYNAPDPAALLDELALEPGLVIRSRVGVGASES